MMTLSCASLGGMPTQRATDATVCPVKGLVVFTDDFGELRPGGPHPGIDMGALPDDTDLDVLIHDLDLELALRVRTGLMHRPDAAAANLASQIESFRSRAMSSSVAIRSAP